MNLLSSPQCSLTALDSDNYLPYPGHELVELAPVLPHGPGHVLCDDEAASVQHVCSLEDGLLVVEVLERDHQGRPTAQLGPRWF